MYISLMFIYIYMYIDLYIYICMYIHKMSFDWNISDVVFPLSERQVSPLTRTRGFGGKWSSGMGAVACWNSCSVFFFNR